MRCSRIKQHNCRSVIDEKHTNDHIWSFLGFLHCDVIDLPVNIVQPSNKRNRISSTGRRRGGTQLSEEGGCMDWGIGSQSDLSPHKRSTSIHPEIAAEQDGTQV
jgi:hypothetical protein